MNSAWFDWVLLGVGGASGSIETMYCSQAAYIVVPWAILYIIMNILKKTNLNLLGRQLEGCIQRSRRR